jgi:hypothetical protein
VEFLGREPRDGGGDDQQCEGAQYAARRPEREEHCAGEDNRHADEGHEQQQRYDEVFGRRKGFACAECVAKQGCGLDVFGTGQRPEGKDQRGEDTVDCGLKQGGGVQGEIGGDGQTGFDERGERKWDRSTQGHADCDANDSQDTDLQEIRQKDCAPCCAEGFEDRDDVGFAAEV